jgi:DNA-directed RNA polymerase subunit alpha
MQEKRDAVLDIPVTDFELSVRSRNCLKKMNINTLGDLLRTTEPELLAYKNFGETSLREIKAMLAQKGLSIGQNAPEKAQPAEVLQEPVVIEGGDPEIYSRSVATLELSVRSRKCLQRLGINTIGELLSRSEQELLQSRNFGETSLKEIKNRLMEMGVSLKTP